MYNKTKYLTDKIGGILSIVLGAFMFLGGIFMIFSLFKTCRVLNEVNATVSDELFFVGLIGFAGRFTIAYLFISFGARTMGEPFLFKDSKTNTSIWIYASKGKNLTLIILSGLFFLVGISLSGVSESEIVGNAMITFSVVGWLQWIQNLLCLAIMVLKIIALCLKDNATQQTTSTASKQNFSATQQQVPQSDSVENKIKELKRLKELCVITEEQYQKAVEQLVINASK